jgi:hypothetical protein
MQRLRWQASCSRHVLVVDDTWVSDDKAQSASLSLKAVGAAAVTVICIGR